MNVTDEAKCKQIMEHYGSECQMNVLVEECAELIQAVEKLKRVAILNASAEKISEANKHFIEELADVQVMLTQMQIYLAPSMQELFEQTITAKLDRQIQRIENSKQKEKDDYKKWRSSVNV